ncbi:hypothetical protein MYCTH_2296328 [Thermothelomyces thermophilus ATCC 42464]|uniref:Homeobox domain-containing protein n=1 Tax=Thermothelomyces thermophilus (strain ATCC 42464 / BCRC 31852 / DSM 1799) TaxID=573729 RepID=G2Q1E4_THET4|nr:uncharacterized protein MYCTH_2296328 [Thermothelomyces thermophilus ATCC 42464]AEO54134.1 hypothetical protein MYCTH_2296328 [Thermothelomyces thermophilus ATCC 42464]
MDMDYLDPYQRRHPDLPMQLFAGDQQAHPQAMQYPYWNPLMAYYQQQHRAAALVGHAGVHLSKPAEPKPRLAKDEVELLEREFAKNQKPNSSTKRELAEKMGVEVPRINNWFQNRRAKEKQIRKTAEFEAQQARERAAAEAKSASDRDQDGKAADESSSHGGSSSPSQHQGQNRNEPGRPSTGALGQGDNMSHGDHSDHDDHHVKPETGPLDMTAQPSPAAAPECESPAQSDSGASANDHHEPASASQAQSLATREAQGSMPSFGTHDQRGLHQPTAFPYRPADTGAPEDLAQRPAFDVLPTHHGMSIGDAGVFSPFAEHDYFSVPQTSQFPSEMAVPGAPMDAGTPLLRHHVSVESLAQSEVVSPASLPGSSPSAVPGLRFKSPPPPADIAGRRKSRRPAPLGLSSLRCGPGPKTGVEVPRRADTVSPMRRISSATGSLYGRVQKTFVGSGGPRSPFATDRNREALLQSLKENHAPAMAPLGHSVPAVTAETTTTEGFLCSTMGECGLGTHHVPDDNQGYPFGTLSTVGGGGSSSGNVPLYDSADHSVRSQPGTPGLQIGIPEGYFSASSGGQSWVYAPQDEPLPTPSLCSHGGSELEFSMAPQPSGYIASQPVTPSFPPAMGPPYASFFAAGLGQADYQFPESYPAESSARSSPVVPPRSKQFQFAQNVTPQDFNMDKP